MRNHLAYYLEARLRALPGTARARDAGAGVVEYLLLVLFIALALIVSVAFFSGQLSEGFRNAGNSIPG